MSIRIITDSTCDISTNLTQSLGIDILPLKVIFGDQEYLDGETITKVEFYNKLKISNELPTTSQINPEGFMPLFKTYCEAGDEVIGIFISSKLSGTYQSAVIAKKLLGDNSQINLIDSNNTTFALALLVFEAIKLRDAGFSAAEIVEKINNLKNQVVLYGILDTLEYLKKGGRLSASAATIGTLLNIKPIITFRDGLLISEGKTRGLKAAYKFVLRNIEKFGVDEDYEIILAHTNALDKLDNFKAFLTPYLDLSQCRVIDIGSVVGTHAGPGAAGIAWIKKIN